MFLGSLRDFLLFFPAIFRYLSNYFSVENKKIPKGMKEAGEIFQHFASSPFSTFFFNFPFIYSIFLFLWGGVFTRRISISSVANIQNQISAFFLSFIFFSPLWVCVCVRLCSRVNVCVCVCLFYFSFYFSTSFSNRNRNSSPAFLQIKQIEKNQLELTKKKKKKKRKEKRWIKWKRLVNISQDPLFFNSRSTDKQAPPQKKIDRSTT